MNELDGMSLDELVEMNRLMDELLADAALVEDEFEIEMMILEDTEHPRYSEVMAKYE